MSEKLKNIWKQFKSVAQVHIIDKDVVPQVKAINKEMKSRATKAPFYKEPTYQDLSLAYKDAAKINKKNKKNR